MIQEVKRKIHFTSYVPEKGREKDTDNPPTVSIAIKPASIRFGPRTIAILAMEGKFISFYYEATKKIVGWTLHTALDEAQIKSAKYRLVKVNPATNSYTTTIQGILNQIKGLTKESYKNLEIKKYVEQEGILSKGDVYYFVQLTEDYETADA